MSRINRRQFLQFTGSFLTSLGLSQLDIQQQGDKMGQLLAQSTPRKLALLVGINQYAEDAGFSHLQGCVTDVELQRQLLTYRFGFKPKDILTLTDAQATRTSILEAFEEHLIKQAKPGDVVVFHYSGHGSQVVDPDKDYPDGLNSTFVPADSKLPPDYPVKGGAVQDIMGHTLFLLMSALQTENVTAVLDSCYSGGGTRGNFRVRSRNGGRQLEASPAEFEYQQQWLSRLNLSPEEFIKQRRAGVAKGAVIASTKRNQLAADAPFSDFFAGAFTYLMTQYLWQQTGTEVLASAVPNIARSTTQLSFSRQEPIFEVKPASGNDNKPLYFINRQTQPAEAVVTNVSGDQATLWLGGLDPQSLAAFGKGAVLTVMDARGGEQGLVQLESRNGLIGRGKLLQNAQAGSLLQERARGIPADVSLRIGLDLSIGNDAGSAKQAIDAIRRIEVVPVQQKEVDYILGRMTGTYRQELQSRQIPNLPAIDSIGLFSPSLEVIPGSFGAAGESVSAAVSRLQAKLKSLLAARIVKLTLNSNSSRLNLVVSMTPENQSQVLAQSFTARGGGQTRVQPKVTSTVTQLPLQTPIQFQIENKESRDLYLSVLVIDSSGEISVVFPNQWTASDDVTRVSAGQTLAIPDANKDGFKLITQEPKGMTEVLIVASSFPLRKALQALRQLSSQTGVDRGPVALNQPTEVMGDLLDDLGETTRGLPAAINPAVRGIDTTQMAALSITFEVV
ncbi:caspase family protein [Microcoleus sp. FACHB-672]|uniref:caspase family protein n=1 Tax=Microcoleus sp. FACHB-672 TaxID=2692825 RepID=UPI001688212F|nr:caspase family protein [Microcoleus sp. FACHB-672]MBD2042996.1 caspase family protein [Microcoleus sp. FACHB-672]